MVYPIFYTKMTVPTTLVPVFPNDRYFYRSFFLRISAFDVSNKM